MGNNKRPNLDFIHKYDETLNLIYRKGEKLIVDRANSVKSTNLPMKLLLNKKTVCLGFLLISCYATFMFLLGSWLTIAWQKNRYSKKTEDIEDIVYELDNLIDTDASLFCTKGKNVYKLHQEVVQSFPWSDEPKSFTLVPGPVSITKYDKRTQTPNAYLSLASNSKSLLSYMDEESLASSNNLTANKVLQTDFSQKERTYEAIGLYREFLECMKYGNNIQLEPSKNPWLKPKF